MRVTITLEHKQTALGQRPKLEPVRIDIDGPVSPASLDEIKSVVRRLGEPADTSARNDVERLFQQANQLAAELSRTNDLLRRLVTNGGGR